MHDQSFRGTPSKHNPRVLFTDNAWIKVKLWNTAARLVDIGHEGTKISIRNLVVRNFRGQVNLRSTQETRIEESTCLVKDRFVSTSSGY